MLLAALGVMFLTIATASRKSLLRPTRFLSFAGLLTFLAAVPILFISEIWSVVAATGFALECSALVYESQGGQRGDTIKRHRGLSRISMTRRDDE